MRAEDLTWFPDYCHNCGDWFDTWTGGPSICFVCLFERAVSVGLDEADDLRDNRILVDEVEHDGLVKSDNNSRRYSYEVSQLLEGVERGSKTLMEFFEGVKCAHDDHGHPGED